MELYTNVGVASNQWKYFELQQLWNKGEKQFKELGSIQIMSLHLVLFIWLEVRKTESAKIENFNFKVLLLSLTKLHHFLFFYF